MNILSDFFFQSWQQESVLLTTDNNDLFLPLLRNDYDDFCDSVCIILIISKSNFTELSQIKESKDAIKFFTNSDEWNKESVQEIQQKLLYYLTTLGNISLNKGISKRLDKLGRTGIIGYETSRKLISQLSLIKEKKVAKEVVASKQTHKSNTFYESSVLTILNQINILNKNIENTELLSNIREIPKKLDKQKFSIGITGVMNAGKSTMLNALLGHEVLGTSVVPETANLSIIKYAKEPKASVNFWNTNEWENIEKSADSLESMKHFVTETREHFSNDFTTYVTDEGHVVDIPIDELPSYTSAEHSGKRCNLVKSVELYSDLEFVKNGVEIVDTPGLDDPVIQREEITKSYLMNCDLLCHLMNVSQSATQKDIDFIVDSLLYRSVAQLLVVITRIDTVTTQELAEVIEYTKSSIRNKLESLNKTAQFDSIIERINFIPIAGKMALLHRIGRGDEALKHGYSLKKSGIEDIEAYLSAVLFGDDSHKARLIIEASQIELSMLVKAQIEAFEIEQQLLGKDTDEIAKEYAQYQKEIAIIKDNMLRLNEKIDNSRDELVDYFSVLENFAKNKMKSLQDILKRRVYTDVTYDLEKNNKKPTAQRIATIIETGLQDGFIDLLRDYRYQFQKRVDDAMEKLDRDFEGFAIDGDNSVSNSKEFFEKHFSNLNIVKSNVVLIQDVNNDIKSHSKKNLQALDLSLQKHFEIAIDELHKKFIDKADKVHHALLEDFEKRCKSPLVKIKFKISSREKILTEASNRAKDNSFDSSKRTDTINDKLAKLHRVATKLSSQRDGGLK